MHIEIRLSEAQEREHREDANRRPPPAWFEELLFEVIPVYRDVRVGARRTQAAAPRVLDN